MTHTNENPSSREIKICSQPGSFTYTPRSPQPSGVCSLLRKLNKVDGQLSRSFLFVLKDNVIQQIISGDYARGLVVPNFSDII